MRYTILFFLLVFNFFAARPQAPLACSAGNDVFICPEVSPQITGSVTGGTPPFSIQWEPAGFCTNASSISTTVNVPTSTTFTLTVIDNAQDTCMDVVSVFVNDIYKFGAGPDKDVCYIGGAPVTIGDPDNYQGNYTFSWLPVSDLSNPSSPNPIATPSVTTTFTLNVNSPACGFITDVVTVFVHKIDADAGQNVTIDEGQTTTLQGTGGTFYFWTPEVAIKYFTTATPDANPTQTITYYLQAMDELGCSGYDSVTVFVRPSDEIIIYNTFTPNNDGENDVWVIPNLYKYPDNRLEIYNRYGQLVYKQYKYESDWNGKYLGEDLPAGTYFYYLDTSSPKGKYKGTVTIMR